MTRLIKKILARMLQLKIDLNCRKKINKISKNIELTNSNKILEKEYLQLWKRLGKTPSLQFLKCLGEISGIQSSLYVPENIQYGIIEPVLNNKSYALVFNDKNFFERYLPKYKHLFPVAVLRGINGVIHDADFRRIADCEIEKILNELDDAESLILKPAIDTGGGVQVQLITKQSQDFRIDDHFHRSKEIMDILKKKYFGSFVLQKRIFQHPWFEAFNRTSLNTVRLYTYRSVKTEIVHPLHAYVRFGNPGSIVDSSSQGGLTCGIALNGILNDFAIERLGKKRRDLDGIRKNGKFEVPFFSEMKKIAGEIAAEYHYHRLLGFDFGVDKKLNVRLMEINTRNVGVINQQMNTGPLYREYTDEIIEYCLQRPRSIVFDFYV